MIEEWRAVPGYEGLYEVSNTGFVRRVSDWMVLKCTDRRGYCAVKLSKDGERKSYSVHRLVAIAFIPNPDGLPQINHKDENKKNNIVDNLEWCDHKYNNIYGTRLERIRQTRLESGSYTGLTKQEYRKKYNDEHPVDYHYHYDSEYYKSYYEKNKEKMREKNRMWREKHPDYMKKWMEKHPDYMKKWKDSRKNDD